MINLGQGHLLTLAGLSFTHNMYINHDPVMNLTQFIARSTWVVAYTFEWGKLLKCHLKGKTSRKLANGQNIDNSEKRKWPKGFICPCTGIVYHNIQTYVYWYIQQISVSVYRTIGRLVSFLFLRHCFACQVASR